MTGMALAAFLMLVNFAACSSNNDVPETNEEGVVINEKKLFEMQMVEDDENITYTFFYDEKDRLSTIKIVGIDTYNDKTTTSTINYTWGNGVIIGNGAGYNETYTLNNDGLVKSLESSEKYDNTNQTFTYNSSKQLVELYQEINDYQTYTYTSTYNWDKNKITMIENKTEWGNEIIKINYANKTCKGYFPLGAVDLYCGLVYVHPELMGIRTNQLPSQIVTKWDDEEDTEEISYSYTNDGYIESCTIKETEVHNGVEDIETIIYTFKWQ